MPSAAARKTQVAHFTITGEGFTRIARDFMLSELPGKAWRLVTQGLSGGAERFAADVLDGKKKLVGNESSMKAVKDASKGAASYIQTLKYIYAGRICIDRTWWRPKTEIVDFGPDDMDHAGKVVYEGQPRAVGAPSRKRDIGLQRVAFYADKRDRVVEVKGEVRGAKSQFLIFEPCGEPPMWWPEHTTPEAALKDFLAAGRELRQDGWSYRFHEDREEPEDEDDEPEETEEERRYEASLRADRDKAEQERYAREDAERLAANEKIRADILAQAAGDMMDLHTKDGVKVATVPRAPFVNWALNRTSLKHLAPPWNIVAPMGMKMPMDDQHHTDWFYGATVHVTEAQTEEQKEIARAWRRDDPFHYEYSGPLHDAAHNEMWKLQDALGEFEAAVIVDAGEVSGEVGKDVIVLSDLSPDHVDKIAGARAIITETGGRVAHLAMVALERSITIMRVSDAVTRYPVGTKLTLTPATGKIETDVNRW